MQITLENDANKIFKAQKNYDDLALFVSDLLKKPKHTKKDLAVIFLFEQLKNAEKMSVENKKILRSWLQKTRAERKEKREKEKKEREEKQAISKQNAEQRRQREKEESRKKMILGSKMLEYAKQENDYRFIIKLALLNYIEEDQYELFNIEEVPNTNTYTLQLTYTDSRRDQKVLVARLSEDPQGLGDCMGYRIDDEYYNRHDKSGWKFYY